jgi:hypothetical protein
LADALTQFALSPEVITFIERHMLMEEKRSLLRFLSSLRWNSPPRGGHQTGMESPKTLSIFAQLCGRREELLLPVVNDMLSAGIITTSYGHDGETTYVLTDDLALRPIIDNALAAYDAYPELRHLLIEFGMG